jgi:pyruvate formate lyase activating enzyme
VASCTLHPAPPQSYTVFLAGCNFKCLNCQNWTISQYPTPYSIRGFIPPEGLARECIEALESVEARVMGADRVFFSGGEPTCHLPYIEEVIKEAKSIKGKIKVNFDTNGYMTEESLYRVLTLSTSITFDIKAVTEDVHKALTGASSLPVLRNAKIIAKEAKEKLWEFRILVIPKINEGDIKKILEFIASLDEDLPICFLAFRPNFALYKMAGASKGLMEDCLKMAESIGLKNVSWCGLCGILGEEREEEGISLSQYYAREAGCKAVKRECRVCKEMLKCPLRGFHPKRNT